MTYRTAVPVGSGGMGVVYKAWDPDLERFVALKYLRYDDPVLVERLLREARAQARVDHPGVCKVYEVGEEEGRPFIAMQYVDGQALSEAAVSLTLEQKVLLVKQVTEAVQAAHAAGLVHRDLKPGNVMVATGPDGELRPYVLDFGIAREREVAGLTLTGQVLGTPGYLSPEQARGDLGAIDRRTDLFSLGVILYELLSGVRPFEGESTAETLVALLEEEPVPLRRRAPQLPRDLETVVARCLEKDPARRYESARALADDLGRFLDGEPVHARPISRVERLLRLARRHRLTAALAVASSVAILALLAVLVAGWVKYTADLKRERNAAVAAQAVAEEKKREAEEVTSFLMSAFEVSDPQEAMGEVITAREILDRGAERVESELAGRPATQARMMGVIGIVYQRLGLLDRALPPLEKARAILTTLPDADPEAVVESQVVLGALHAKLGQTEQALEELRTAATLAEERLGPDHVQLAFALSQLGQVLVERGAYDEAENALRRALGIAERALGPDDLEVATILHALSDVPYARGDHGQSEALSRRALAIRERHYGPDNPRVATVLNSLGATLQKERKYEEAASVLGRALAIREKTLGPDHPRLASTLNNLAVVYQKTGQLEEAESLLLRALAIRERALGAEHPRVAAIHANLALVYREEGKLDLAERSYRRAVDMQVGAGGPDHPDVASTLEGLARVFELRGQLAEAETTIRQVLAITEKAFGPEHRKVASALRRLALLQRARGHLSEAESTLKRALLIATSTTDPSPDRVAEFRREHAAVLRTLGREAEAAAVEAEGGTASPAPPVDEE